MWRPSGIERDVELWSAMCLMKRFNLGAVRTSHDPNHSRSYELCDESGLCVLDEGNVECNGALKHLAGDPRPGKRHFSAGPGA